MKTLWEDMWTIPFNGNLYLCWKEKSKVKSKCLNADEETRYFEANNQERVLNDFIRNVF